MHFQPPPMSRSLGVPRRAATLSTLTAGLLGVRAQGFDRAFPGVDVDARRGVTGGSGPRRRHQGRSRALAAPQLEKASR